MRARTWARWQALGRLWLAASGTVWVAGCGDLTSGGFGEVEVGLAADSVVEPPLVQAASFAKVPAGDEGQRLDPPATVDAMEPIEGTVTVALRVYVRRGARNWEEVTEGEQIVTASLQATEASIMARSDLPVGSYTEARTRFSMVVVDVVRGLVVDGVPVTGRIAVIESGEDPIDLPIPLELEVEEGALESVVVELRAGTWLRLVDRDTRRVAPTELEEALRLRSDVATRR